MLRCGVNPRHTIGVENAIDLRSLPLQDFFQFSTEGLLAPPHAERDIKHKGQRWRVHWRLDRHHGEPGRLRLHKIASYTSPDHSHIDCTLSHCLNSSRPWELPARNRHRRY